MAEKSQTQAAYSQDATTLVRAGLLFVAVKLGDLLDEIVVVGGIVPTLLVDQATATEEHTGTIDLDLALSLSILDEERYRDLADRLRDAGFAPVIKANGNRVRQTWAFDGRLGRMTVDFLIASAQATPPRLLQDLEQDLAAIRTRALGLAFVDDQTIELDAMTIMGDRAKRAVRVAGVAAMLVLKAFAFRNRGAEKDAYDAFYLIRELGVDRVVATFGRFSGDDKFASDIRDALTIFAEDFVAVDGIGAGSVARFVGDADNDDLRADVVGAFRAVLRRLGFPDL